MKKLIIIVLMVLLVPISYVSAGDKDTLDLSKDKTLMSNFLDPIEEQGQIIGSERIRRCSKTTLNVYWRHSHSGTPSYFI